MLIKLTKIPQKSELYLHHSMVLIVDKDPSNPLQTIVITSLSLGKGPVQFNVLESCEEIAQRVNSAQMAELRASKGLSPELN